MGKWDKLRQAAHEASKFRGSTPNYYVPIQAPLILELIAEAENAQETSRDPDKSVLTEITPDGMVEFREAKNPSIVVLRVPVPWLKDMIEVDQPKPKSVVEQTWEAFRESDIGTLIQPDIFAMALAEAVEFIELYRRGYKPCGWDGNAFEAQSSILAILKGEKKRDIPKA